MGVHGEGTVLDHISGQVSNRDLYEGPQIVVNPAETGVTGWGDANGGIIEYNDGTDIYDDVSHSVAVRSEQLFQTGHTQNVVSEDSAEAGFGVGPERKHSHYPYADNPNPFRNHDAYGRWSLDDADRYRPEVTAYWAQAMGLELSQAAVKQRSPVTPIVDPAPSIPYVESLSPGGYYG